MKKTKKDNEMIQFYKKRVWNCYDDDLYFTGDDVKKLKQALVLVIE